MGVYLSKACKHIDIENGEGGDVQYCMGECQGWRKNMEDAHIAEATLHLNDGLDKVLEGNSTSIFGVFDGHGAPSLTDSLIPLLIYSLACFIDTKAVKRLLSSPKITSSKSLQAINISKKKIFQMR